MSNAGLDRRIFDLEESFGLRLPKDADLPAECDVESCPCMDEDILTAAREILEVQSIRRDLDAWNREYYSTHFTDGTPIVIDAAGIIALV